MQQILVNLIGFAHQKYNPGCQATWLVDVKNHLGICDNLSESN